MLVLLEICFVSRNWQNQIILLEGLTILRRVVERSNIGGRVPTEDGTTGDHDWYWKKEKVVPVVSEANGWYPSTERRIW